ncbi:MAG: (2Fe-2S)-binding protein [Acidobacteriaceae bacterium]|nr:(2Fe-2S)-binding protein [Acidobacteriaceae bacterium]MBV9677021.1 (2Fe-2S)-binding protein [Acidobacteriaceae bacterium]
MSEEFSIQINGKRLRVPSGVSVAAAIFLSGQTAFRTSVTGEPRAALCGMGICFECRVTIDGSRNCRSCQMAVRDGMVIETS